MSSSSDEVTRLLAAVRTGDAQALNRLLPIVYRELRDLAGGYLRDQRSGHTLQPTALVHEAYLRLIKLDQVEAATRAQFFRLAAQAMRSILVDHARARRAAKRGHGRQRLPLDDVVTLLETNASDLVALSEALDKLAQIDEDLAWLVELKFFGGLTAAETAEILGVTSRTVEREWRTAKAWLRRQLRVEQSDDG
jgi:RNA polymerase sigma-70 factor (ECF subfamily)